MNNITNDFVERERKKGRRAEGIIQSIEIWNQSVAAGMPVTRRFHEVCFFNPSNPLEEKTMGANHRIHSTYLIKVKKIFIPGFGSMHFNGFPVRKNDVGREQEGYSFSTSWD